MRKIKNILVTGGKGFIGWNFCNLLLQDIQFNIINIDDLTYASKDKIFYINNKKQYQFYKKNICDRKALLEVFNKHPIDAVVHFAAETHVDNSIEQSDQFVKTNVLGTHNLIQICKEKISKNLLHKDFVFIHISTDEVFGNLEKKDPPFTEETKYNPRNPYSASKAAADHLVRSFIATYNFPAIILNCCNNFGPFQLATGLYFYDERLTKHIKKLKPSRRGEYEITDLNKIYQKNKQCFYHNLSSTDHWYDLGQISDLDDCSTFLKIYQQKRELNIGQLSKC